MGGVGYLEGGWYYVTLDIHSGQQGQVAPVLYPDYGSGMEEHERIEIPSVAEKPGSYEALVRFPRTVHALRLDPMATTGEFTTGPMSFRRLSRPGAAWVMLVSILRRRRGKRAKLAMMKWALARLLKGGIGRLGAALHDEYVGLSTFDSSNEYERWIRLYGCGGSRVPPMDTSSGPLISVLMPVYNTPEKWLRRSIASVLSQDYGNWELCIADDASTQPHVRRILQELASAYPRVKVVLREKNGHISATTNSALEQASGKYVALLDHDDELPPTTLSEVASALAAHPEWRMLYTDEDKIDELGRRYDPYFKPDWNYELFLSQNCFSHLGVFETKLVRDVGGFREGLEGSQDWDLALRCCERVAANEIGHLPKVLYHWRAIPGSTALAVGEKSYAVKAGERAVTEHLARVGARARVLTTEWGHYRLQYDLPQPAPKVSLVIPTRDRVHLLKVCIDSILERTTYPDFEIIVVDNQSGERETLEYLAEVGRDPRVRVLHYDAPFNYSAINNYAVREARGSIIGLINNDVEVITPQWLDEMVGHAARPDVGAVGAMLYYPNDTIQHAGVIVGLHGVAGHAYSAKPRGYPGQMNRARLTQSLTAVTAACLVVRKEIYDAVGGLDEQIFVAFNDVDFCLRVRSAGYRNVWTPFAELYHYESASRGLEDTPEKMERFMREVRFMTDRWGSALREDPAYNPNLTLEGEPFGLAFPPRNHAAPLS
jgi:glycosyltransferase involved in cell wall biosynthesis